MRLSAKLLHSSYFHIAASAQFSQTTLIAGRAICKSKPIFERRPELAANRIEFLRQKMVNPVYASQNFTR
jgi:hypothetical protein